MTSDEYIIVGSILVGGGLILLVITQITLREWLKDFMKG